VTFALALRSILRQDPDVIMIGEMRDAETAEIAIQAALTGHFVLSTLHTNDAVGAIPRLLDLGVPEYLLAATLEGVLAQRLVRILCTDCRERSDADRRSAALLPEQPLADADLWRPVGCAACRGTGFRGRIGLFELLRMDEEVRDAVVRRSSAATLRDIAVRNGMRTMRADAWCKVRAGITSLDEVLRVLA
jgi:general secretion pathway protein E